MKVVGKIDLGSINQSTRPKRKSKEERRAEREAKAAPKSQSRHVRHRNRTNEDNVVFFSLSDYNCRSTGCYHEHRAVSADNGFTCHNTFVLADGVTFNFWGC